MSIKAEPSFSLKDGLFNAETLSLLTGRLKAAYPDFRRQPFERKVLSAFPELELKERIRWIVRVLEDHLPERFPDAMDILRRTLPEPLDPIRTDDDFGKFIWVVPGEYVARHGCTHRHLKRSLSFLRESTKRFTAEASIRPFLRDFPTETLAFVHDCATDDNYHVRRLASEGIRPLLPWAERVRLPEADIISVLNRLQADPARFVTRSVANTLNDISKKDPELVIHTLQTWQANNRQDPAELNWMTRHALRTLTKRNHPAALELLGFTPRPRVEIRDFRLPREIEVGDSLDCAFTMRSPANQKLLVTLRVGYLKANGKHATKVFTVAKSDFSKGEDRRLSKKISFAPQTTRTLYPGIHKIELAVNGKIFERGMFELIV